MEFKATNYNEMAPQVYAALRDHGVHQPSRNGDVLRIPEVVTMTVTRPWERVNFSPARDANPFFHLMEAMAMLVGFNNAPFLSYFARNMANYSDDGQRFNAFYGTRLLQPFDQLATIAKNLQRDPTSRREVALIWDPYDLVRNTKDKACNLMLLFEIGSDGSVEMTSFNRSNDAIWGMVTGANVVHLSFIHEYVAMLLKKRMGRWQHVTNNLHVYLANPKWAAILEELDDTALTDGEPVPYPNPLPLWGDGPGFIADLRKILHEMHHIACTDEGGTTSTADRLSQSEYRFTNHVTIPVFYAWHLYKLGHRQESLEATWAITAEDWRLACQNWLQRRRRPEGGDA